MTQKYTNCPNCNFPDKLSGYHFQGKYKRGHKCDGCGYFEKFLVKVDKAQFSQRCSMFLEEDLEILAVVDRSIPSSPIFKYFEKRKKDLIPFEPNQVQKKVINFYVDDEFKSWLKLA